jgi:TetR/AcrR family transcriptional regulator, transcriptional repressor for nem operon
MKKGLNTRNLIVEQVAPVFNTRGFFGTTVSDLASATGLQKGSLYNHFASKDALALAAFDFAIERFRERFKDALAGEVSALRSLEIIVGVLISHYRTPVVAGGCPIQNTAIEADDTHPVLRARAQQAMRDLLALIEMQVARGIAAGEIAAGTDAARLASLIIAQCEGALMLSRLFDDPLHIQRAEAFLLAHIRTLSP